MAKMFINGELVDAQGGKTMDVKNPANGSVVDSVPRDSSLKARIPDGDDAHRRRGRGGTDR